MVALLVSCSLLPGAMRAALDGEWLLQSGTSKGGQIPIVSGSQITLKIDGATAGGASGCNSYGGKIEITGTTIKIGALIQTEMACLDNQRMVAEAAYLSALHDVTTGSRDGDTLILSGPQVDLHFVLVPPVPDADLVGPTWVLDSLINGNVASSTVGEATLHLNADGTLTASTGCRTVHGTYTVSGNKVEVTLQPYDTIGCPGEVGSQDAQVLAVISNGFQVLIRGDSLTLTAANKGLGYRVDTPASS
jgi:heat shock protein HslJ